MDMHVDCHDLFLLPIMPGRKRPLELSEERMLYNKLFRYPRQQSE